MTDGYKKFTIKMQKKLVVLVIFVLLAFVGLAVRLVFIVKGNATEYEKQILSQQRYDSDVLPAKRGDIVDAKGTILATSEKVYTLFIDSAMLNEKEDYMEPTMAALSTVFPEVNIGEVRQYIANHQNSKHYVLLKQLPFDRKQAFTDLASEDKNIKGVFFDDEYIRKYPENSVASDVIGFTTSDGSGLYGLEEYYNDDLNGTNGREYGYVNDDSAFERTTIAASDGYTIHSTIDFTIQSIVEKYLYQFNEEHKDSFREGNGAENVACIIQNINNGEILAMGSYPNFDLNDPKDETRLIGANLITSEKNANGYDILTVTSTAINESVLGGMTDEEKLLNLNNLWKNFCITNTYEPGSTAKPFTVAAALEAGVISPGMTYECNGYMEIGGYKIRCHNRWGDGVLDLQGAIARSCNVVLMKVGQALGTEEFARYQGIFNFGLKTNVDLAGEARTANLIYSAADMGPTDLATNTFGQNFNVTMIQMITGFSALINGGYYYEPHMVDKITNANGATIENIEPRVLKQIISESTSDYIRQYCRAVVMPEGGDARTGKTARPAGYAIGGKTGTAETIDPETNKRSDTDYVVSFMGYAPADDPQIAIYVVVDRPNAMHQDDAKFATGIVKNILTEVLPYLNIYMTEELSESEIEELQAKGLSSTYGLAQNAYDDSVSGGDEGNIVEKTPDVTEAVWKGFAIDPATGYRVDPETGEMYDAETGVAVTGESAHATEEVPVNENIIETESEQSEN
ncbi:MAG: cell division protein FtsI [Acetatifactor sp.]|nr:cell division protein FtsI [Acetatifactor sp.]